MIFYLIIFLILTQYIFNVYLEFLNSKVQKGTVPELLRDEIDEDEYRKSLEYEKANRQFSLITGGFNLILIMGMLFFEGFAFVNYIAGSISPNPVIISLVFFAIILFGSGVLNLPFSLYHTFVIEERFGFNKTTVKTYITDKIKGIILTILLGGSLLALIAWIYLLAGQMFWVYALIVISAFMLFMNFFYSSLIVPLYNRQTPLEEGELREKISEVSIRAGFKLDNIFVIDGSKRSLKANAYFAGLGQKKRIVLYDTLLKDLSINEIVAVLTHEIGHYRKKHIRKGLLISLFTTGFTLWLFSQFAGSYLLSDALGVDVPSFHIGLISFTMLYSPISMVIGLFGNHISRKHEFEADAFAAEHFKAGYLIDALKKLSVKNLSNLHPHPLYVFFNYSHPPLIERLQALKNL